MNSDDLSRRYGELSQKIKSFKMAATRDFSERVIAHQRIPSDENQHYDTYEEVDTCDKRRRPASSCVSRNEWISASRLQIEEPDFLRRLHEQIWRSICYVRRQTTCFCDDDENIESILLQTRVRDLERQLYKIEDDILEKQISRDEIEEDTDLKSYVDDVILTNQKSESPDRSLMNTPIKEKENQLPAVYVPRKNRIVKASVNKWNTPISAQNLCSRESDTSSKRQRIGPLYVKSEQLGNDKKAKGKRKRKDLAPLKVHKVMKESTSWLYFKKN